MSFTTRQRIPKLATLEGNFLEATLPVRAFATLTTPRLRSLQYWDDRFSRYIQALQRQHRTTLGWVRSVEYRPQLHIHAALVAHSQLDCAYAATLWQEIVAPRWAEAAKVEPYQGDICGLGYVLKELGCSDEDVRYSPNLAFFAPSFEPVSRLNSAQRRQCRRINMQLERAGR